MPCAATTSTTPGTQVRDRLKESWLIRRVGLRQWHRGEELLRRHGRGALVVSQVIPTIRTLMLAAAGAVGLPYRTFLVASAIGSTLWNPLWVLAGTLAAGALHHHPATTLLSALVLIGLLAAIAATRRRSAHAHAETVQQGQERTGDPGSWTR
ncbi:DedA family protein [Nocardioides sp. cx-173]|uniref:DedA family protein n=1 Tax=Nocardioides sp. cx-173 TaxID=2898796 RepID=UPI001E552A8C|nr:VTT domain-containing protein [Nocardioides sp. cx-173]MCD4525950.1 VTT domain-containing protein [Nocardioides sp. cx-173]UGB43647.1 VTT domain-containing protein [Nocardioides sp. cx-173]